MRCATLLVLIVLIAAAVSSKDHMKVEELEDLYIEYQAYKDKYNKTYTEEDENYRRMMLYKERKEMIILHNKDYYKGLFSWKMVPNKYTDMKPHEVPAECEVVGYI